MSWSLKRRLKTVVLAPIPMGAPTPYLQAVLRRSQNLRAELS